MNFLQNPTDTFSSQPIEPKSESEHLKSQNVELQQFLSKLQKEQEQRILQQLQFEQYLLLQYNQLQQQLNQQKKNTPKSIIQRMIIFDWDDTLFPTFQICESKEDKLSLKDINNYGQILSDLFTKYIETFDSKNIFIVTNGSYQWVTQSLQQLSQEIEQSHLKQNHFKYILQLFDKHNISITSARELHYKQYPNNREIWKRIAINDLAMNHFKKYDDININCKYIITSIGDSREEFIATEIVYKTLQSEYKSNNIYLQRIKLNRFPSFNTFISQLNGLIANINEYKSLQESKDIRYARCDKM